METERNKLNTTNFWLDRAKERLKEQLPGVLFERLQAQAVINERGEVNVMLHQWDAFLAIVELNRATDSTRIHAFRCLRPEFGLPGNALIDVTRDSMVAHLRDGKKSLRPAETQGWVSGGKDALFVFRTTDTSNADRVMISMTMLDLFQSSGITIQFNNRNRRHACRSAAATLLLFHRLDQRGGHIRRLRSVGWWAPLAIEQRDESLANFRRSTRDFVYFPPIARLGE